MRPLNFDTPVIDEFGDIHTLEEYAGGGGATDISEKEVSFISDDELNPSAEKVVSVMTTGSKLKDLMSLLSKAVSNLRYVLSFIKSNRDMITDEYDSTRSYVVDDYCTHNGIVYKCIVNTSGTFNDSDWLDTTITTELSGLNNSISSLLKIQGQSVSFNGGVSYIPFDMDNNVVISLIASPQHALSVNYYNRGSDTIGLVAKQYGTTDFTGDAYINIWYIPKSGHTN